MTGVVENPWNYVSDIHASHVIDAISELRKNRELCDVILVVNGHHIAAHRLILSACSPYFHGLFEGPCHSCPPLRSHPIEVPLSGIDAFAVEHAIDYCYTSHLVIDDENVWSLLPAASLLQLEEVQNVCCDFLKGRLKADNCVKMKVMAAACHCPELTKLCDELFRNEFEKVILSEGFTGLTVDNLASVIPLSLLSRIQIHMAINSWLMKDRNNRALYLPQVFKSIPWLEELFPLNGRSSLNNNKDEGLSANQLESQNIQCLSCSLIFQSETQMKAHAAEQHGDERAKTPNCRQTVKCRKVPQRSQDVDEADQDTDLVCEICYKHYHNNIEMTNHCLGHMEGDSPAPAQGILGINEPTPTFGYDKDNGTDTVPKPSPDATSEFLKSFKVEKRYCCKICSQEYTQEGDIYQHCTDCHGNQGTPTECMFCHKVFNNKSRFIRHLVNHSTIISYLCPICQKPNRTKANLQIHMRIHTGERPFICSFCKKGFRNYCVLKVHVRSHTGEKPFKCHICTQSFTKNIHLKRHIGTHSGEKPFNCDMCGKGFGRNDHLQRHIKTIHTLEKPHACTFCGKQFFRRYELDRHLRHHTKSNSLPKAKIAQSKPTNNLKPTPAPSEVITKTENSPQNNPPLFYYQNTDIPQFPAKPVDNQCYSNLQVANTISNAPGESYLNAMYVPSADVISSAFKPCIYPPRPPSNNNNYTSLEKPTDNFRLISPYQHTKTLGDENFNLPPPDVLPPDIDSATILPFPCN